MARLPFVDRHVELPANQCTAAGGHIEQKCRDQEGFHKASSFGFVNDPFLAIVADSSLKAPKYSLPPVQPIVSFDQ
ncbi:MAG: hypothetical protein E5V74_04695 [Mesorhizobium sp.]|nr:MAG: hypothetical protein E5V74_04695 [Mesorhizobium sp.]